MRLTIAESIGCAFFMDLFLSEIHAVFLTNAARLQAYKFLFFLTPMLTIRMHGQGPCIPRFARGHRATSAASLDRLIVQDKPFGCDIDDITGPFATIEPTNPGFPYCHPVRQVLPR